jgi:glycine cleavage system aminomethyltransferase T
MGQAVGMIRVEKEFTASTLWVEVRNKKLKAGIVPLPFYKRNK